MSTPVRRGALAPALLAGLVTALVGAGCGGSKGDSPQAGPSLETVVTTPAGSPVPPATTPATTPTKAAAPTKAPATSAPRYPASARDYAWAVVRAWVAKELDRLGELTTPQVHEQLIEIPGPPDTDWALQRCDGAAGSQYCRFINADGDVLTLRVSSALLGSARATVEVRFEG